MPGTMDNLLSPSPVNTIEDTPPEPSYCRKRKQFSDLHVKSQAREVRRSLRFSNEVSTIDENFSDICPLADSALSNDCPVETIPVHVPLEIDQGTA